MCQAQFRPVILPLCMLSLPSYTTLPEYHLLYTCGFRCYSNRHLERLTGYNQTENDSFNDNLTTLVTIRNNNVYKNCKNLHLHRGLAGYPIYDQHKFRTSVKLQASRSKGQLVTRSASSAKQSTVYRRTTQRPNKQGCTVQGIMYRASCGVLLCPSLKVHILQKNLLPPF